MTETRQCQNCRNSFVIEPDDFQFYEKIQVPAPTFCPKCRMQRRFAWRNERTLHRNVCWKSGKKIISGFAPDSGMTVYDRDLWWSDDWDPLEFGQEYDFSRPFFEQWSELFRRVPEPAVFNTRTINCDYTQYTGNMKDAYLVSASWGGENLAYAARAHFTKDSFDVFAVANCELCYEDVVTAKSVRLFFSQNCDGCIDSMFLYDCRGCSNCIACANLRNKQYCIFNFPYTKDEYRRKLKELNFGSYRNLQEVKKRFEELKAKSIRRYANLVNCRNVTGDNVLNTANCLTCFDVSGDTKDCKFIQNGADRLLDSYDGYGVGAKVELLYEAIDSGVQGSRECFCATVYGCNDAYYCFNCHGCGNIFGCIGLRNKEYCILNKQYDKETFTQLRGKIISHMDEMPYVDKKGIIYKYGEFFPMALSPFAYNDTVAQEYFPLTKEQAIEQGYRWKDPEERNYKIQIPNDQLPDNIRDVKDDIINKVIQCSHAKFNIRTSDVPNIDVNFRTSDVQKLEPTCNEQCTTAFKIIPDELQFLRKMNLPLPRLCPNCRHYQRLKQRNPLKLWHRKCQCAGEKSEMSAEGGSASGGRNEKLGTGYAYENTIAHFHGNEPCPNEFETSYAPDRPEIVYCEQCYNAEVV